MEDKQEACVANVLARWERSFCREVAGWLVRYVIAGRGGKEVMSERRGFIGCNHRYSRCSRHGVPSSRALSSTVEYLLPSKLERHVVNAVGNRS